MQMKIEQTGLTFGDGFLFGCGFITAVILSGVALAIFLAIVALVLSLFGVGFFSGFLRQGLMFPLPVV